MPTVNIPSQIVVQTAAQWAVDATVYSAKRILVTSDAFYGATDQRKIKIPDGTQAWSALDYFPVSGYDDATSSIQTQLNNKEGSITAGVVGQYWRGDKSWQTLDTSVVPENTNLYYTDTRVRATVLTGLAVAGGAIVSTDTVLAAFGKAQNQINALLGGVNYQGTWNATTNIPALVSSVGTKGYYYVVSVAGGTNLDGVTDWKLGDWVIFNGTTWEKVDNTDAVISVNGYTGAVVLAKADIGLGNVENTALSTWAGSTSLVTLGSAITGTGSLTLGTSSSVAGSIVLKNASNAFTQTFTGSAVAASRNYIYPITDPTAGQVLSASAPVGADITLSWATAASGLTIGGTAITGGTDNRILFQDATASDFVTQIANFTMGAVATGFLDVPVGYAIAGSKFITINSATRMTNIGYLALGSGDNSTFLGHLSGGGGNTGARNTYIGARTGGYSAASSGRENTGIGDVALQVITSGNLNTSIGTGSLLQTTTGSYKIAICPIDPDLSLTTLPPADNNNSTIAIGVAAYNTASNQGVLGSQDPVGYISNWFFNGTTFAGNAYSVTLNGCAATGTDKSGGSITFQTGLGSGAGSPSSFTIKTPTTLATGTTATTAVSRLIISGGAVTTDISTATWAEALDFVFGTTTGSKIGNAANNKIGKWGAVPIVQPTTAFAAAALVSNGGTTLTSTDTFDGYTILQVVAALRASGNLA